MKHLTTIQKTFKVFKVLSKVAMILSFVWCGLALLGAICGIVWRNGGGLAGEDMETILILTETTGMDQMICSLLSDAVFALTDGILFLFAFLYFKEEQMEGTPFTQKGADKIKSLGIKTIVLPLVAVIVSAVVYGCFGLENADEWSNASTVVLGIMLILASLVFRYGAELEAGAGHE